MQAQGAASWGPDRMPAPAGLCGSLPVPDLPGCCQGQHLAVSDWDLRPPGPAPVTPAMWELLPFRGSLLDCGPWVRHSCDSEALPARPLAPQHPRVGRHLRHSQGDPLGTRQESLK